MSFYKLRLRVEAEAERVNSRNCVLASSVSVSSLSLFYRYSRGGCTEGLSSVVLSVRTFACSTCFVTASHSYTLPVLMSSTVKCSSSFFPRTATLWNSLPTSCFPLFRANYIYLRGAQINTFVPFNSVLLPFLYIPFLFFILPASQLAFSCLLFSDLPYQEKCVAYP